MSESLTPTAKSLLILMFNHHNIFIFGKGNRYWVGNSIAKPSSSSLIKPYVIANLVENGCLSKMEFILKDDSILNPHLGFKDLSLYTTTDLGISLGHELTKG